jgi:hypothetical protein
MLQIGSGGGDSHKFASNLPVAGKHGSSKGIDATNEYAYDNAFMQVQLCECFELINRKDDVLKQQKQEIDSLWHKVKKSLHMQD